MLLVNLIEFNCLGTALKHPYPFLRTQTLPFSQGGSGSSFLKKGVGSGFYNLTRLEVSDDALNGVIDVRKVDDGPDPLVFDELFFPIPNCHEDGRGGFVGDEEVRLQKGDVVGGFKDSTEVFFVGSRLQEATDDMGQRVLVLVKGQEFVAERFDQFFPRAPEDFTHLVVHSRNYT